MSLAWPAIKELLALREKLNELFDEVLVDRTLGVGEPSSGPYCPTADLYETDDEVVIILEIPGVHAETIDLQLHGKKLRVAGEIVRAGNDEGGQFVRMERPAGVFYRDFELPVDRFSGSPVAELERGVLTVRLPKASELRRQRVTIVEEE